MQYLTIIFIFLSCSWGNNQDDPKQKMVNKINEIRLKGCNCGGEEMAPVQPLTWNDKLYESALLHAKDMYENNNFSHSSIDGKDVSERITSVGYKWAVVGENIGKGQKTFDEVLVNWIESTIHCTMMMNPSVDEIGIAEYKTNWVQHFGKQLKN